MVTYTKHIVLNLVCIIWNVTAYGSLTFKKVYNAQINHQNIVFWDKFGLKSHYSPDKIVGTLKNPLKYHCNWW